MYCKKSQKNSQIIFVPGHQLSNYHKYHSILLALKILSKIYKTLNSEAVMLLILQFNKNVQHVQNTVSVSQKLPVIKSYTLTAAIWHHKREKSQPIS